MQDFLWTLPLQQEKTMCGEHQGLLYKGALGQCHPPCIFCLLVELHKLTSQRLKRARCGPASRCRPDGEDAALGREPKEKALQGVQERQTYLTARQELSPRHHPWGSFIPLSLLCHHIRTVWLNVLCMGNNHAAGTVKKSLSFYSACKGLQFCTCT